MKKVVITAILDSAVVTLGGRSGYVNAPRRIAHFIVPCGAPGAAGAPLPQRYRYSHLWRWSPPSLTACLGTTV